MKIKKALAASAVFAVTLSLAACANPELEGQAPASPNSPVEVAEVAELAALLPDEIRERGYIQIAATSTNLPAQYTDSDGELVGFAVELYTAAAASLGVEARFDVVTFDAFMPGLESGRYDFATMGDNVERQQKVDIIDLHTTGNALLAHSDTSKDGFEYPMGLCGRTVAVTKSSIGEGRLAKQSEECASKGLDPISVSSYVDNAGVALAVTSQQDEFGDIEATVGRAYVKQNPAALQMFFENLFTYSGPAFLKDNTDLRDAVHAALLHLVKTGVYDETLERYGVAELALPELPMNQAK